ncbi:DNA polymerase family B [uncultured Clostridium sp.]|nr:DNA polymerase family B [uncultured Clostridium sp.]SCJ49782.1 DNA polymerase family B [uncultured Clostridium sp.]
MLFYDFEVFKYDWMVVVIDVQNSKKHVIVNDRDEFVKLYEENKDNIWIGYNSRHYDQWIMKGILLDFDPKEINDFIIVEGQGGWKYSKLMKEINLNNFDIMTSMHGLKQLEGFMGNNIKESEVSFDIDRKLTEDELQEVIKYCEHDVEQTIEVFLNRQEEFDSQVSLLKAFNLPISYISKTKAQLSAMILGAHRHKYDDEFDISIPDTLKIKKYQNVVDWYKNPINLNYKKELEIEVMGVKHKFAWGGIHGAKEKYYGEGIFVNVDVASYYPALMIEYNYSSRSISDPNKYKEIRDKRIELKKNKDPMQLPYKIVLNGTYGAMKDKYNPLYDPRQANNVCVAGQLLLLDLIEHVEVANKFELIQSNTDGVMFKLKDMQDLELLKSICSEWENRTRMVLEYDIFTKIYQKDVNNYITVEANGKYKSKGAYVKKLTSLDYDLPIVNKALVDHFISEIPIEDTIMNCNDLKEFQKIVKLSSKYKFAIHNGEVLKEKTLRVFASRRMNDDRVYKVKIDKPEKIANTPDKCFIINDDVNKMEVPRALNKKWYVEMAYKRLMDFMCD